MQQIRTTVSSRNQRLEASTSGSSPTECVARTFMVVRRERKSPRRDGPGPSSLPPWLSRVLRGASAQGGGNVGSKLVVVGVFLLEHAAIVLASRDLDASTFGVKTEVIRILHTWESSSEVTGVCIKHRQARRCGAGDEQPVIGLIQRHWEVCS